MTTTTANAAQRDAAHASSATRCCGRSSTCSSSRSPTSGRSSRSPARARATLLRAARRCAASTSPTTAFPYHGGAPSSRSAAACRRGSSASRSRASSPTRSRVPARYGDALARALMQAGRRVRHHALRHRGARRDAHREGPCRRQRAQRPHHRARSRARPHDVDQEGLHRPRPGAARRRCSIPTARRFVGFKPVDRSQRLRAGAHLLADGAPQPRPPTTRAT